MPESTAYSCPHCHATLKLEPHSGKLVCDYCGGEFDVDQIEAYVDEVGYARRQVRAEEASEVAAGSAAEEAGEAAAEVVSTVTGAAVTGAAGAGVGADAAAAGAVGAGAAGAGAEADGVEASAGSEAANAGAAAGGKPKTKAPSADAVASYSLEEWDAMIAEGKQERFDEVVGYTCTNCGAQVVTDKLTVATSCQYCGSSVVVDQRLTGGMKPGFVIPFKVKAEDLPQKLTDFYAERPLLPDNFFYDNQVGEVQGIYVPFWLYDGTVKGSARYEGTDTRVYVMGKYDVTETDFFHCDRAGTMSFDNIPVDASERIDDDLMDSIEPFDYKKMKPFKAGYLTGFVAERFDQSPRQVLDRASLRMGNSAESAMESTVSHSNVTLLSSDFQVEDPAVSYVLLPVYLFNCEYRGKHYRYAVNGQSGKIVGEVPICKKKSFFCFLKGLVGTTVVAAISIAILAALWMIV